MSKYICIEGCIGAGKSTLTAMLSKDYNAPALFENFEENPYLSNFYANPQNMRFL
ncbi:MAG: deoxynucleoside kinase [Chitinophagales bacterium]|nr:deoxynucleoside kinase [Chitinophagales bacterium]